MSNTELLIILIAAIVAALVKSIAGFGYPLTLIPLLAVFIDVADAVVIVAPSNFVLNLRLLRNVRDRRHQVEGLSSFVPSAVLGAVIGALLLPVLPGRLLRALLVALILMFLLTRWRRPDVAISPATAKRYSPAVGAAGGLVYGATGIAGPIVSLWFLGLRLPRDVFVFSVTAVFALNGITQLIVLALRGLFVPDLLWPALALIPVTLFSVPVGLRVRERVSIPVFERFTMTLLAASAMSIFIRLF